MEYSLVRTFPGQCFVFHPSARVGLLLSVGMRTSKRRLARDGFLELKVPYTDDRELIMDIMKYGSDCQVIEPKELRDRVIAEIEKCRNAYGR